MRRIAIAQVLAVLLLAFTAMPALASPSVTTIHEFTGADGQQPNAALIQGLDGLLYGDTNIGGTNADGTVFKIDTGGVTLTDLLDFDNTTTPFGSVPVQALVQGTDGNLYGMTVSGGAHNDGTVFKVAPDGTGYTELYDFGGVPNDAINPDAGLIQASDGNFYGTTQSGGANGDGAVFEISSVGGSITILYSFGSFGPNDLTKPKAALIQGEDGSLYGTAEMGGDSNGDGGVFRINLDGSGYAILHTFTGGTTDGANSYASLVQGGDGFLYGTTINDGTAGNGTVFKIAPDGTGYQTMYSFASDTTDVGEPFGALALGNDGNLYGSGFNGGANTDGGLFDIARNGTTDTLLHSFAGTDGLGPDTGLVQATNGTFYGTTLVGTGNAGLGTIFSLDNGLPASPTGLYALGSDATEEVFWTTDTNAATYNVYRSTTSGGEGGTPFATGLAVPHFFDNAVSNGTQYFYQVTSVDAGSVESAKSYEVSGTPQMAIATTGGLSASPNPVTAVKSTIGTLTLNGASAGPTTAFLSSDNPNVTFTSPDVTVASPDTTNTFTINTNNTGSQYTADITASENGTDATTTITVDVPSVLHTFQSGLQMIAANTDDTGITLANDFGQQGSPSPELAVWTGSAYAISPTAPANKIVPGQGYWFHPGSTADLYDIGTDQSDGATVDVSLSQGWNMIGEPYNTLYPVDVLQVQQGANTPVNFGTANTEGLVADTLYTWQPGDSQYEVISASGILQLYEGYWLYAFTPCTLIFRPLP